MKISISIVLLFLGILIFSQKYKAEMFIKDKDTLLYRIKMPKEKAGMEKYPLLIFLHGAGERGNDNEKQLVHGSKLFTDETNENQFPAIVIFPQCPAEEYWANVKVDRNKTPFGILFPQYNDPPTKALSLVIQLIEKFKNNPLVDVNRIYIGGLSMGGMGTYEILYKMPNTFAAAFVICGAGNTEEAKNYANEVPLWIFHGAQDAIVSPEFSMSMVDSLLKLGAHPNFTLYSDYNHNSWDAAFKEPNFLPWLFSHYRK